MNETDQIQRRADRRDLETRRSKNEDDGNCAGTTGSAKTPALKELLEPAGKRATTGTAISAIAV